MKNSFFYYLILFLIVASCKQPNEQNTVSETESTETATTTEVAMNDVDDPPCKLPSTPITNCFSDREILPEAAFLWQGAWIYSYNSPYFNDSKSTDCSSEPAGVYKTSPQTFFSGEKMSELYNEVKDEENAGVLISYISSPDAPFNKPPGLAIQNIVNCNANTTGPIYVAPYLGINSGEPFNDDSTLSNASDLAGLKLNWKNQMSATCEDRNVFKLAQSYVYSWDHLKKKNQGVNALTSGISINLGLRTLEPQEDCHFPSSGSSPKGEGAIVYVNVLYFGQKETVKSNGNWGYMENFAKPCPVFCNDN